MKMKHSKWGYATSHGVTLAAFGAITALTVLAAPAAAQRPATQDTVVTLDAMVVTADRVRTPLASSVASVSVLSAAQLHAQPQATVADALRQVPGFALVHTDGQGYDPQLMVRGFYGGGEAEYVLVLLDGKPLNDVQAGLIAWDAIPLATVERIEIVRGGSSALWGDAAVAGVINVVTRGGAARGIDWRLAGGSYGTWRAAADAHTDVRGRELAVFGGIDRTAGFRDGAERTTGRAGGSVELAEGPAGSLRLHGLTHWRAFDEPGPLPGDRLASDRTATDVFYRFDRTRDRSHRLGVDGERDVGARARLSASVTGELRDVERVRTIVLAPTFADTKERVLGTARALATVQLSVDGTGLPITDRLAIGFDGTYATLNSEYYNVLLGDRDRYAAADGARVEFDAGGSGRRGAAAAFAQYSILPVDAVRISAGARWDWLRDSYTPGSQAGRRAPAEGEPLDAKHTAFSPRVGINVQYVDGAAHTGHVYASAGRSFKAPTLDQLFDERRLPVPFPPFTITISNALLVPQHGTNLEVGIFHGAALLPGSLSGELSLSVYQMDMEDELDFDLQTLRYINIGRSRHRGLEAGLRLIGPRASTAFLNYTRQEATSQVGDDSGNYLRAIPRDLVTAGVTAVPIMRTETGLVITHTRGMFLDNANTIELDPFTRVDARLALPLGRARLFLDVRNLLDAQYSTTGFPDHGGEDVVYYYPAAGRTLELGLSLSR